jgi:hypothetical protein
MTLKTRKRSFRSFSAAHNFYRARSGYGNNVDADLIAGELPWVVYWSAGFLDIANAEDA